MMPNTMPNTMGYAMIFSFLRLFAITAALLLAATPIARAAPLEAVASFSILADMVREIGGERVRVTALVGPDEDSHAFVPQPSHARLVAKADLVVVNGMGFEGWVDRLIAASAATATVVVATAAIETDDEDDGHDGEEHGHDDDHDGHDDEEHGHDDGDHGDHGGHDSEEHGHDDHAGHDDDDGHSDDDGEHGHDDGHGHGHDHGGVDPHAWQDVAKAQAYVRTIADALVAADPQGSAFYRANAERYGAELAALDRDIRAALAAVPPERRRVLTVHDAFGHFGQAYGIVFLSTQGFSTDDETSAFQAAALIRQLREGSIAAVLRENITDNRQIAHIAREAGIAIGGTLYSDALSGPDGPAASYIDMMRHNTAVLLAALLPASGNASDDPY